MNIDAIIENAQLKGRIIALDAQVETLTAEVRCLEAVIRSHERVDCLLVKSLKEQLLEVDAEVARLNSPIANSEQENARLKAEVERLEKLEEYLQNTLNQYALDDMRLQAKVERLTKAGGDLVTWVLIMRHNNPNDIEDIRLVILNWNAAKGVRS